MKVVRGGALPAGLYGTCVRGMADSRIKGRTLEFMLSSNPASDPEYQANRLPLIAWSRAAREGWAATETMRACFSAAQTAPSFAWQGVRGPAGAVVLALKRLGWEPLVSLVSEFRHRAGAQGDVKARLLSGLVAGGYPAQCTLYLDRCLMRSPEAGWPLAVQTPAVQRDKYPQNGVLQKRMCIDGSAIEPELPFTRAGRENIILIKFKSHLSRTKALERGHSIWAWKGKREADRHACAASSAPSPGSSVPAASSAMAPGSSTASTGWSPGLARTRLLGASTPRLDPGPWGELTPPSQVRAGAPGTRTSSTSQVLAEGPLAPLELPWLSLSLPVPARSEGGQRRQSGTILFFAGRCFIREAPGMFHSTLVVSLAFQLGASGDVVRRKKVLSFRSDDTLQRVYETISGMHGGPPLWPKDYAQRVMEGAAACLRINASTEGAPDKWQHCLPSSRLCSFERELGQGNTVQLLLQLTPSDEFHDEDVQYHLATQGSGPVIKVKGTFLDVEDRNEEDRAALSPRALSDPGSQSSFLSEAVNAGVEEVRMRNLRHEAYIRQRLMPRISDRSMRGGGAWRSLARRSTGSAAATAASSCVKIRTSVVSWPWAGPGATATLGPRGPFSPAPDGFGRPPASMLGSSGWSTPLWHP
ncbi:unnamed protein product [Prorocentrum cordatum]|uniref:Uncharacterized protein n=1 Tax=Prorocentrum cordatum TaxID=2364126 RepID=A0ABN9RDI8_9DINO|nr:unnamed protein product [Polarella glacialis]